MATHEIFNTAGISLRFDNEEHRRYEKELLNLKMSFYHREVITFGIWASNQNKYVSNATELNEWDGRETLDAYRKWLGETVVREATR